ncbi:hypothetical protein PVAP13_8KG028053 [Panicum virgatum]|uniref:Uncharacterized protein n=1 Tax=Panicum virgatum TaxID=38727 RepID=A0A8T0PGW9_PANVG|nr:hypothetical protein PVAP13_8KG028053 [Panicum virgatum]
MGSEEAPLLLLAPVVEGCPGCAIERQKASSKGRIPYRELFFVGVTSFASWFSLQTMHSTRALACTVPTLTVAGLCLVRSSGNAYIML